MRAAGRGTPHVRAPSQQRPPLATVGKLFGKHKLKRPPPPELADQQARRTLIFGYGNHVWPRARVSAGLLVVSSWVKSLGLEFKRDDLLQLDVAEAPRILFARPTCYLPGNRFNTLSRLMNQYSLTSKELVLVYPDETVLTGMWKDVSSGGGPNSHLICQELAQLLGSEHFTRIGVGIGRLESDSFITRDTSWRPPSDWNEAYMRMKPPPQQYKMLLAAASHIHATWNTRYEEEVFEIQKALEVDAQSKATAAAQAPQEVQATRTTEQMVNEVLAELKRLMNSSQAAKKTGIQATM